VTNACFANGSRTPAVCPPPMHNRFESVHQLYNAHTHPHGIAHKPATPKSRIVAIISTTKRPLHSRLCMAASQLKTNRTKPTLYRYKLHTRTHTAQLTSHWAKSNTPLINIFPTADVAPKSRRIFACPFQLPINLQPPEKGTSDTAFKLCHFDLQSDLTRNLNSSPSAKLHQKCTNEIARTPLVKKNTRKQPDKVNCTEGF
jgi:hypothetical protein